MTKKDLKWFQNQKFESASQLLEFAQKEIHNAEKAIIEAYSQKYSSYAKGEYAYIEENAAQNTYLILLVVNEYLKRTPDCTAICLVYLPEGVPELYDISNNSDKKLWFCNGMQPEWFDDIPIKLDIELEGSYYDAECDGKQEEYLTVFFKHLVEGFSDTYKDQITVSSNTITLALKLK